MLRGLKPPSSSYTKSGEKEGGLKNGRILEKLTMRKIKQMDKTYILNREDPNIIDHFKKLCQEK